MRVVEYTMLKTYAKELRKNQTDAERHLWTHLRNRAFLNYKFRRQYWIEKYIVDFVCLEKQLVIELDGSQHQTQKSYDEKRTHFLESKGFRVVRFWDNEVLKNTQQVLEYLYDQIHPHPNPLPLAGEGVPVTNL